MSYKNSYIRWQDRRIEEFGKAINLLLSLSLAAIGFVIAKILDEDFEFSNYFNLSIILIGISILLISVISLLCLIYNRLNSIRTTAKIARKRETRQLEGINILRNRVNMRDKCTWILWKLSIFCFILGNLFIIIGFIMEINNKYV